jgi:large subunit ribosomal protein L25
MLTLDIKARDQHASLVALRKGGSVPAVVYGPKEKSFPIAIDARTLAQLWRKAGETTLVSLQGAGEAKNALIRELQFHPLTGDIIHADFYVPEKGVKIEIEVPLVFVGTAPAEKLGFVLVKTMHEIEIEVAPENIPHNLEVDISTMANDGDHITASQIKLPHGASLVTDEEEIIVSVTAREEEAAPVVAAQPAAEEKKPAEQK